MHKNNIKRYECDLCDKTFKQSVNLKAHQLQIHLKLKPFKCQVCEKDFNDRSSFQRHTQLHISNGHKTHECELCNRKFETIEYLRRHIEHHLDKVFSCKDCGKDYTGKRAYNKHREKHNQNSFSCFKCDKCDMQTNTKENLRKHVQNLHVATERVVCNTCNKSFKQKNILIFISKLFTRTQKKINGNVIYAKSTLLSMVAFMNTRKFTVQWKDISVYTVKKNTIGNII